MMLGVKFIGDQLHEEAGRGQKAGIAGLKELIIWRKAGHGILSSRVNDLVPRQVRVIFWKTELVGCIRFFTCCGQQCWLTPSREAACRDCSLLTG